MYRSADSMSTLHHFVGDPELNSKILSLTFHTAGHFQDPTLWARLVALGHQSKLTCSISAKCFLATHHRSTASCTAGSHLSKTPRLTMIRIIDAETVVHLKG
jgi:hypothetical protein